MRSGSTKKKSGQNIRRNFTTLEGYRKRSSPTRFEARGSTGNKTSRCTFYERLGVQRDQKERRIRLAGLWEAGETEKGKRGRVSTLRRSKRSGYPPRPSSNSGFPRRRRARFSELRSSFGAGARFLCELKSGREAANRGKSECGLFQYLLFRCVMPSNLARS
jgi:hypothetical protein